MKLFEEPPATPRNLGRKLKALNEAGPYRPNILPMISSPVQQYQTINYAAAIPGLAVAASWSWAGEFYGFSPYAFWNPLTGEVDAYQTLPELEQAVEAVFQGV